MSEQSAEKPSAVEVSAVEASSSSCPRIEFGPRSAHWNEKVSEMVVAPSRGLANGFLKSPNCIRGEAVRMPCAGSCRAAAAAVMPGVRRTPGLPRGGDARGAARGQPDLGEISTKPHLYERCISVSVVLPA